MIFCTFLYYGFSNITLWSKPDLPTSIFCVYIWNKRCFRTFLLPIIWNGFSIVKFVFSFSKMNWDRVSCYMEHNSVGFFWRVSLDARILSLIENRNKGNVIHRFIQLEKTRENWLCLCHALNFWLGMYKDLYACLWSNHIKVQNA